MDGIVFRRARESDAAAMADYVCGLVEEALDTVAMRRRITAEEEVEFIRRANEAERAFFMLAFDGGRVIGLLDIWAGVKPSDRHAGRMGMSVAKDWRGRGIGRRLLAAGVDEAKAWPGFCRIELDVVVWNTTAIALYERMGFVVEARKTKAIDLRGQPEDTLLMALVW